MMFIFALTAFGQSNEQIEQELIGHIKNIEKWSNYGSESDEELLSKENEIFEEKLLKYTKIASTLNYKFSALDEYLYIAASDDGKFRIFSWDRQDGGTMHYFSRVYQYQGTDGKVYSKAEELEEGDPGGFVYDIFTLDTKSGKVYLVCSTGIFSGSDNAQAVNLYKITGSSLDDNVKLIKTRAGMTNSISFAYNFLSVADREERPVKLILYDKRTKTLKIPVVIEDKEFSNGKVTNRFINYRFNGTYFVKVN